MTSLIVHVVPRARRTEVVGPYGDAIRIRIAAPPVDGAANAELVRYLAERLGVTRSRVEITAGASGRRKTVTVSGLTSEQVRRGLLTTDD
jgi:uncharacterized protein (TIGR00251 family)